MAGAVKGQGFGAKSLKHFGLVLCAFELQAKKKRTCPEEVGMLTCLKRFFVSKGVSKYLQGVPSSGCIAECKVFYLAPSQGIVGL